MSDSGERKEEEEGNFNEETEDNFNIESYNPETNVVDDTILEEEEEEGNRKGNEEKETNGGKIEEAEAVEGEEGDDENPPHTTKKEKQEDEEGEKKKKFQNLYYNIQDLKPKRESHQVSDFYSDIVYIFGFESEKLNNLYFLSQSHVLSAIGNYVYIIDIHTLEHRYIPGIKNGGVGAIAVIISNTTT